ncbi:MAG TPA: mechanosensitive ion channel family protein [Gemmatimonadaceae bacterium]|nr:mechanosensitive ion channel family protein [Gemmatimonadaceae bacterium]
MNRQLGPDNSTPRGKNRMLLLQTLRDHALFGISYLEWINGAAICAVTIAALWGVREVLVRRLKHADATATWIDDLFLILARRTSRIFMLAMGVTAAGLYETSDRLMPTWLRLLTIAAFCWQLLRWANASVDFWLHRISRTSDGQNNGRASLAVVGVLIRVAIFIIVLVLALDNFGINVTALVTGLGITGIAVALAVQNILGDLLAALAIAFDKPFTVGDEITVGDTTGRVERVGLKTTRLRLGTGEEVSIANAEVMKNRLTNQTRTQRRMLPLTVGVAVNGISGDELLALASRCEAAAGTVAGVSSAKARLQAVVDGRARIVVESVLDSPQVLLTTRPLLIAALTTAATTPERPVLGVA